MTGQIVPYLEDDDQDYQKGQLGRRLMRGAMPVPTGAIDDSKPNPQVVSTQERATPRDPRIAAMTGQPEEIPPQVQMGGQPKSFAESIIGATKTPSASYGGDPGRERQLMEEKQKYGVMLDKKDPQYRMGTGQRVLGTAANFLRGFGGYKGEPINVGPGAVNNKYERDEEMRKSKEANATTGLKDYLSTDAEAIKREREEERRNNDTLRATNFSDRTAAQEREKGITAENQRLKLENDAYNRQNLFGQRQKEDEERQQYRKDTLDFKRTAEQDRNADRQDREAARRDSQVNAAYLRHQNAVQQWNSKKSAIEQKQRAEYDKLDKEFQKKFAAVADARDTNEDKQKIIAEHEGRKAELEKAIQEQYKTIGPEPAPPPILSQDQQPQPQGKGAPAPKQGQPQKLDANNPDHQAIAKQILAEAKGNKDVARRIAKQRNFSF